MLKKSWLLLAAPFIFSFALLASTPALAQTAPYGPGGATITLNISIAPPGATITVTGTGFLAGETITIVLFSTPVNVGSAVADSAGAFSKGITIPANIPAGAHTLVSTGLTSHNTVSAAITVAAPSTVAAIPAATPTSTGLAFTGTNAAIAVGAGGLLLALGGIVVLSTRRRRSHTS